MKNPCAGSFIALGHIPRRRQALRQRRDSNRASELLTQLESAARGDNNLVPLFITCVENDVTLGEICDVLRSLWGEYQPPAWL